jgi:stage II sporulation protein D
MFTITGAGYGHGIGMSQWGAYGYAKHGWTYRRILSHYYSGVSFAKVANRPVRVLLSQGQNSVRVSAAKPFQASCSTGQVIVPTSVAAVVSWSAGAYHLAVGNKTSSSSSPIVFTPAGSNLMLANRSGVLQAANLHYRGSLRVLHLANGLAVINTLSIEDYLCGVVPREVPSTWPPEALKAQAVAARSYAAIHVGSGGAFDLYSDTRSQGYGGADGETPSTRAAVAATRGVVPTYGGRPITAYFFSTSGGRTENIENVWGTKPVPYLKGVADPYDYYSPYHRWPNNPIRITAAAVAADLGAAYAPSGSLQTIFVTKRGFSPRVVTAYAIGSGAKAVTGAVLRVRLGLRDTWFTVRTLSIDPGKSTTITYGQTMTLRGRIFPALARSEKVILHYQTSGTSWRTVALPPTSLTRGSVRLPGGKAATYSSYAATVAPTALTCYFVSVGTAQSPRLTLRVRPSVQLTRSLSAATVGDQVSFAGVVRPKMPAGTKATLQLQSSSGWVGVGSAALGADGTYTIPWTATATGTFVFRLQTPAAKGLAAATSDTVTVTVSGPSSSPSLSTSPPRSPSPSPTVRAGA